MKHKLVAERHNRHNRRDLSINNAFEYYYNYNNNNNNSMQ